MKAQITISDLRYCITEYFDSLINQIDVFIETQIQSVQVVNSSPTPLNVLPIDEKFVTEKCVYFNLLRNGFIKEIETCKEENLKEFEKDFEKINNELESYLALKGASYSKECEWLEKIKENFLFKKFCFLWKTTECQKETIYLIMTDGSFTQKEIEIIRFKKILINQR